jgi:hypothetical protein
MARLARSSLAHIERRPHNAVISRFSRFVIPGPDRSEGARNPVISGVGYWIPGSPLRGAPE